jgi:trehalose 6-phosphate synthase
LATIKSFKAFLEVTDSPNARRYLDVFIVPSRQQWLEYQELLAEIVECVESCNSKLRSLGYSPIRLRIGDDYQSANNALTRYDYLIVCSIADGLNLVVKEGAILNARNGVIISSPNVGAMAELENYCVVSGTIDHDGILDALIAATKLDATTRETMSMQLKQQVTQFDASHWAESVISGLRVLETV